MSDPLSDLLIKHEGLKLRPYLDSVGKTTIGIGRNLTDCGVSNDEAMLLLANDIASCKRQMINEFPWAGLMVEARQAVLISMLFNMGMGGVLEFKLALAQMEAGEYEKAADALLQSRWAMAVGQRAQDLAHMMRIGDWFSY